MKLCSFIKDGRASYGLVVADGIVDLGKHFEAPSLRYFIGSGAAHGQR